MVSLPGIPHGHITLLRGHSDTGKTTALLEVAVNAQKMGILPVFIVTEMKWSWEHAQMMGLQVDVEKDNEGITFGVNPLIESGNTYEPGKVYYSGEQDQFFVFNGPEADQPFTPVDVKR